MIIKKLLIIKPEITEDRDKDSKVICTHYIYPKGYKAEHAKHICYNFAGDKKLKGGHLREGMVIYEAEEDEISSLLSRHGVEEISYDNASTKGNKWKPKQVIEGKEKKAFDIKDWVKNKKEISKKALQ